MQLNQNSKIETMGALLNLGSQIQPGATSPFQYIAELARPLMGALKGISFAGLFGPTQRSSDPVSKESKRLAYEIRQTLGIKGFVLNLAGSASLAAGLPACWDAVRPCLETSELEDAAAQILSEASSLAEGLGEANGKSSLRLSQVEASHLQAGLDFYHFVLPKMLVLTSALRLACEQDLLKRGMTEEPAPGRNAVEEDGLQNVFKKIRRILSVQGPVSMPRAWSKYLAAASPQLKPVIQGENYHRASNQLHTISRQLAPGFQDRISSVETGNLQALAEQVRDLEGLLPSLIMSITLLELFFRPSDRPDAAQLAPAQPLAQAKSRKSVGARRDAAAGDRARPTAIFCPVWQIQYPTAVND